MQKTDPTDLLGKVFTRLTVEEIGPPHTPKPGTVTAQGSRQHIRYWCLCECGVRKLVRRDSLIKGNSKSCGCLAKDQHAIQTGMRQSRAPRWRDTLSDRRAHRISNDF